MSIRIAIYSDSEVLSKSLEICLKQEGDFLIIASCGSRDHFSETVLMTNPDVILIHIAMCSNDIIDFIISLLARQSDLKIIGFSSCQKHIPLLQLFEAGIRGFLIHKYALSEMAVAIRTVYSGERYFNNKMVDSLFLDFVNTVKTLSTINRINQELSEREKKTLELLVEGKTHKEIAQMLFVSTKSVEVYRASIYQKLKVNNLTELIKYAIRNGITSLD